MPSRVSSAECEGNAISQLKAATFESSASSELRHGMRKLGSGRPSWPLASTRLRESARAGTDPQQHAMRRQHPYTARAQPLRCRRGRCSRGLALRSAAAADLRVAAAAAHRSAELRALCVCRALSTRRADTELQPRALEALAVGLRCCGCHASASAAPEHRQQQERKGRPAEAEAARATWRYARGGLPRAALRLCECGATPRQAQQPRRRRAPARLAAAALALGCRRSRPPLHLLLLRPDHHSPGIAAQCNDCRLRLSPSGHRCVL